ncbi:hypothetical protein [Burkholderia vietnamiensis]|uniref:hypothetical protein n=1 Tax=Burkholderia vietnamiensis TaxID=60552 RepID=UPI001592F3C7|nr:hypothetical protein [Burkholderia vietnamiensis]
MTQSTGARQSRSAFQPTKRQINAAETLFLAMAHEQTIQPIVHAYTTAILAKHQFHIDPQWVRDERPDRVILDAAHTYLLSESDAATYYRECNEARDAAGLKVENPEQCPLLVARSERTRAENELLLAIGETPGLEAMASGHVLTLEKRAEAIRLSLSLLAPFVRSATEIMEV